MPRTAAIAGLAAASLAAAQSTSPALFVSNNGNIEGSVTSFTIGTDGAPVLQDFVLTSDNSNDPGNNANAIDISPNGRYIAVGHAAGGTSNFRQVTILEVDSEANLSILGEFNAPATPLALKWVTNDLVALTQSSLDVNNRVLIFRFINNPTLPQFFQVGQAQAGAFTTSLAVNRDDLVVHAGNTQGGSGIFSYQVNPTTGDLTDIGFTSTGSTFALGIARSPNNTLLYAFGGISSGGNAIAALDINADNSTSFINASPFPSGGSSPKNGAFSDDGSVLFVGHGTDATVRSFLVDEESGEPAPTGNSFDIGLQGTLGEMTTLGDFLYVTDDSNAIDMVSGVQTFAFDDDGNFSPVGGRVDTLGVTPTGIVAWPGTTAPDCPGDANNTLTVDLDDLLIILGNFGDPGPLGDLDNSGTVDLPDLLEVLSNFGSVCANP